MTPVTNRLLISRFLEDRIESAGRKLLLWSLLTPLFQLALSAQSLEDVARHTLQNTNASGFIHVRDVNSDRVLLYVSTSAEGDSEPKISADTPILPLSVIKVFVAALWLENGLGETAVDCTANAYHPIRHMQVEDILITGCDSAGAEMANILRRKLGAKKVLDELRRYGVRDLTLKPDATDNVWGSVLSLGEEQVLITPEQLSVFLRTIASDGRGMTSPRTAHRLMLALQSVVQKGTAISIKDALANTGWEIGGKTGSGPGICGDHCNGWFASILSEGDSGRYVILVFIKGRGLGGGLAARTAVPIAQHLIVDDNPKKAGH